MEKAGGREEASRSKVGGGQEEGSRNAEVKHEPDKEQNCWRCPARLRSLVCYLTSRRSFVLCHIIHNPFNTHTYTI